jgi:hypothetical protein
VPRVSSSSRSTKLLLMGGTGVGKSTLLHRLQQPAASEADIVAIGPSIGVTNTKVELQDMSLTVWDRSGQQGPGTYGVIAGAWCAKAAGAMLVYDGTDEKSFAVLHSWLAELAEYMKSRGASAELYGRFRYSSSRLRQTNRVVGDQGRTPTWSNCVPVMDLRRLDTQALLQLLEATSKQHSTGLAQQLLQH